MKLKLLLIIVVFFCGQVLAKSHESTGCANIALSKEVATKMALMRAKAKWVEQHDGRVVSGRETLLLENDDSQLPQLSAQQLMQVIKVKSAGHVPSNLTAKVSYKHHVNDTKGDYLLCIHLSAKQ